MSPQRSPSPAPSPAPSAGVPVDLEQLAVGLKALADPVRLRLIGSLMAEPSRELCTCDLAPIVGLSEPTVSHHLKRLADAGLVEKERRGVNVYYRAVPSAIDALGRSVSEGARPTP
jgi:ArsR family transcriptional regulator, arsenate/arsenite/antimonite-responsive transcriptional repressor